MEEPAILSVRRGRAVDVHVELEGAHRDMARHAIESLLVPMGLSPNWVEERSSGEVAHLYYGARPESSSAQLNLVCDPGAFEVLNATVPMDVSSVTWIDWNGSRWPVFFRDPSGNADVVAGTFYLLAGIHEIASRERDQHGRYCFSESLQCHLGLASMPVVDAYREMLSERLRGLGHAAERRRWGYHDWAICPTFDVDYLWKWRKGMVYREIVRYLLLNDLEASVGQRLARLGRFVRDFASPGDPYRRSLVRIIDEVRSRGGTATLFFKAGSHGPHDVAYSLGGRWLQRTVADARAAGFEIGLHPSYYAHTHAQYLAEEVERFESQFSVSPASVRQHYLRYDPRLTPELHREVGFKIDSTLGFPGREGFRRSTCMPFRLYDLERSRTADIWEMPLMVMDGTLFNRRGLSADESIDVTKALMDRCRSFGGCAVLLWHNVLWDELDAPGWGRHFLETLDYAADNGAMITGLSTALSSWQLSMA